MKKSAALAAMAALPAVAKAEIQPSESEIIDENTSEGKLIISAPMLQNYAATSVGIAFAVSDMANGYVDYSEFPDLRDAKRVKCGGFRVTDMNDKVMLVRLTGLSEATRYYYRIGADRIEYKGGYDMRIVENCEDTSIYSFTTAGSRAKAHFCVINDTHDKMPEFAALTAKIKRFDPSCVIWNGDTAGRHEDMDSLVKTLLTPPGSEGYAAQTPFMFCPGNHDSRGLANRHFERAWMFRQPEERLSRDWDLGRNFAVRMGDVALIGLDTAEDKVDSNPKFAGLFNSAAYREAQAVWLADALKQEEIASAPFLVAFCHIPLYDPRPDANPGDLYPADVAPSYKKDYAAWQRTCSKLWTPLLAEAGCQLIITGHQHKFRYDAPDSDRTWAQIVGGGPDKPVLIEGKIVRRKLIVNATYVLSGESLGEFEFERR